jgi:hypothetical protein
MLSKRVANRASRFPVMSETAATSKSGSQQGHLTLATVKRPIRRPTGMPDPSIYHSKILLQLRIREKKFRKYCIRIVYFFFVCPVSDFIISLGEVQPFSTFIHCFCTFWCRLCCRQFFLLYKLVCRPKKKLKNPRDVCHV